MGEQARARGNEGMARVCARRAAGIATGAYLRGLGLSRPGNGAYDQLKMALEVQALPASARTAIEHLLLRVDFNHKLPEQVDLLRETRELAGALLGWEP